MSLPVTFASFLSTDTNCSGQNVTIHIAGNLKKAITEGATHTVVFGKVEDGAEKPIYTGTQDLCKGIAQIPDAVMKQFHGQECPIKAGPFNITNSFAIPSPSSGAAQPAMPSGEFYVRGTTKLADGSEVACILSDLKAEGQLAAN